MEHTGKIVNRKENQERTTYMLQIEHALDVANQDKKILRNAIDQLLKENGELRIKIATLELGNVHSC